MKLRSQTHSMAAILRRRVTEDRVEYKVKWGGCGPNKCTWEPLTSFTSESMKLVKDFEVKMSKNKENKSRMETRNRKRRQQKVKCRGF